MDYQGQQPRKPHPEQDLTKKNDELRRAKLKALRLLELQDRTVAQLREKLLQAEFEPEIVEQAIAYADSFGYLDDERYVRNYIECRMHRKSRRMLEQELQFRKGIDPELIGKVDAEIEPSDEKTMIRNFLRKKQYDRDCCDEKQRQKLVAALVRKGFRMQEILLVMKEEKTDNVD